MILSPMTACNKNDDAVSDGLSKYLTEKDGVYILTLPQSQEKRTLTEEQNRFVPYITDKLVETAEKKIIQEFKDADTPNFRLEITEDYLCLTAGLIKHFKPFFGTDIDHKHYHFSERISNQPVKPENNDIISNDEFSQNSETTTNSESHQTDNRIETILSGSDLLRQETIDTIVFTTFPGNVSHSFYGESIQKIRDYLSGFSFVPDDLSMEEIPIGGGFSITVKYADDKTETIDFLCNRTHIAVKGIRYKVNSHSKINIDDFFEDLKNTSQAITEPPVFIIFDSYEKIKGFTNSLDTESQFYEYINETEIKGSRYLTYNIAKTMANYIKSAPIPKVKSDVTVQGFGATYCLEHDPFNDLDVIYKIDGISYRFIYEYNYGEKYTYEGTPVLSDIHLGAETFDLYQSDDRLVGTIPLGEISVFVKVRTNQPELVNFGNFDFATLG